MKNPRDLANPFALQSGNMGIEAFIWNYRNGEPCGFAFDQVRDILGQDDYEWDSENHLLTVHLGDESNSVDIYFDDDAVVTNHTRGIMVSRPINHAEYFVRIFEVMKLGNVMMFYSDDTTPIFIRGANPSHYPNELLKGLGEPRFIDEPIELLR